jgi:hypothetical protein
MKIKNLEQAWRAVLPASACICPAIDDLYCDGSIDRITAFRMRRAVKAEAKRLGRDGYHCLWPDDPRDFGARPEHQRFIRRMIKRYTKQ